MNPPYLECIAIEFPTGPKFMGKLLSLVGGLGRNGDDLFEFDRSNLEFYPRLSIGTGSSGGETLVKFVFSDGRTTFEKVENSTGVEKQSPHAYGYVSLETVNDRLASASLALTGVDHLGFNLPWFGPGLHPRIAALRSVLSPACAYHRFPTGENWDFILPADPEEIRFRKEMDYSIPRCPKFELVSFEKASKPVIQLDVSTPATFETLAKIFPESLKDPQIGNIWVYLRNGFTIDVCLVLNPASETDWSAFFKGYRL